MIVPKRKHFHYYDDYYHGSGIFDNIISKVSSAVTSSAAKEIGRKSLEGIAKGAQKGSEDAARLMIQKAVQKIANGKKKKNDQKIIEDLTNKIETLPELNADLRSGATATSIPSNTAVNGSKNGNNKTIDDRTRMLLDALKHGSGIKTII